MMCHFFLYFHVTRALSAVFYDWHFLGITIFIAFQVLQPRLFAESLEMILLFNRILSLAKVIAFHTEENSLMLY